MLTQFHSLNFKFDKIQVKSIRVIFICMPLRHTFVLCLLSSVLCIGVVGNETEPACSGQERIITFLSPGDPIPFLDLLIIIIIALSKRIIPFLLLENSRELVWAQVPNIPLQ